MAKKKTHDIVLTLPEGSIDAEYKEGEYVKFKIDTLSVSVYKPDAFKDSRAFTGEYNVTLGKKASEPIPVLAVEEISVLPALVSEAVKVLESEGQSQP